MKTIDTSPDAINTTSGTELKVHPLADTFPPIEGAEFDDLVADVRAHGVLERVTLYEGAILDGRNRYRAAKAAGVDCPTVDYDGNDPFAFIISRNLHRRHLSESQRSYIAALSAKRPRGSNASIEASMPTQAKAAKAMKVSRSAVQRAAVVINHGSPDLNDQVRVGKMTVAAAAKLARPSIPAAKVVNNNNSDKSPASASEFRKALMAAIPKIIGKVDATRGLALRAASVSRTETAKPETIARYLKDAWAECQKAAAEIEAALALAPAPPPERKALH